MWSRPNSFPVRGVGLTEKGLLVIDASIAIDLFAGKDAGRVRSAERVFECVSSKGISVYAPRLFVV